MIEEVSFCCQVRTMIGNDFLWFEVELPVQQGVSELNVRRTWGTTVWARSCDRYVQVEGGLEINMPTAQRRAYLDLGSNNFRTRGRVFLCVVDR